MRCYVRRCSHDFADLSPIDACVSSRVCEPDRACTNHSTDGGANTGRTSQKTGTANHHLSPQILEVPVFWLVLPVFAPPSVEWFVHARSGSHTRELTQASIGDKSAKS